MTIRSVAIPLLSGGAMLLGYATFSWLRGKHVPRSSALRAPGRVEPSESLARAQHSGNVAHESETVPLSERAPELAAVLELDLDFEEDVLPEGVPPRHDAHGHDGHARGGIGALFLARATDALSPFGDEFEHAHVVRDPFGALGDEPNESRPPDSCARRSDSPDEPELHPRNAGARS